MPILTAEERSKQLEFELFEALRLRVADHVERLQATAQAARTRPAAWLEMTDIYGDLAQHAGFAAAFSAWLATLWDEGTDACLNRYLTGRGRP